MSAKKEKINNIVDYIIEKCPQGNESREEIELAILGILQWSLPTTGGAVGFLKGHSQVEAIGRDSTFFERYNKYINQAGPEECWVWSGPKKHNGHLAQSPMLNTSRVSGRMCVNTSKVAWWCYTGHWEEKKQIIHDCGNNMCLNPNHLRVGRKSRGGHVFTDKERSAIKREIFISKNMSSVARKYGFHPVLASQIGAGKTWVEVKAFDEDEHVTDW